MQRAVAWRASHLLLCGGAVAFGAVLVLPHDARAACTFVSTAGDDQHVCDSGTSPGALTDTAGDNRLVFPADGSGMLDGDVRFGSGSDRIEMASGTIAGDVDQGSGADAVAISQGLVAGSVQQGAGIDDFRMTGGELGSLSQGDNLDTFIMSGGRIVDAFDDGDHAVMTGGRVGRINMKLDDNLFDMSGGTVDRNLVTGFGNDTVLLSGGTIGGNVSVSGGADEMTVTGGVVGGEIRMSFGADTFTWDGGGILYGLVDLGGDDDAATLRNLADANIGATPAMSGGLGTDRLTLDNVTTGGVARFDGWEAVDATNDTPSSPSTKPSRWATQGLEPGTLTVDSASTLFGGGANGGITPFQPGQRATVANAGRIDLTNGDGTRDTFTIGGDYAGRNGLVLLDTALGDDASPSDKLVIDGGGASGTTGVSIVNAGGSGDATILDGIMVVEAASGATTDIGAFALAGRVAAGAYEYFLFKAGMTEGTGENWYPALRPRQPRAGARARAGSSRSGRRTRAGGTGDRRPAATVGAARHAAAVGGNADHASRRSDSPGAGRRPGARAASAAAAGRAGRSAAAARGYLIRRRPCQARELRRPPRAQARSRPTSCRFTGSRCRSIPPFPRSRIISRSLRLAPSTSAAASRR